MSKINPKSGLVKLIILLIIAFLIFSYFGINIQKVAESETGQANLAYLWEIIQEVGEWFVDLYQKYLGDYIESFWSNIKKPFIK